MKITFLGAARTVTGSCYLVEAAGKRFAIDCGMHQGNRDIEHRNWNVEDYRADELDFVCVTHAHIDHTGLLPRLVKNGFKGPIYATTATVELLEIMLLDSAHIQEMEAEWANRKRLRHGQEPVKPLYDEGDVTQTLPLLMGVEYGDILNPAEGIRISFMDAGHILGSAFIQLTVKENADDYSIVFSGDLGRPHQLLVSDPTIVDRADYLFLESTYGDRNHKGEQNSREELAQAIEYSYKRGEKVIIPAFAIERTQEIIFSLYYLKKEGKLPADMPIYLDSPMAIRATEVFKRHPDFLDDESKDLLTNGDSPFDMENLKYTPDVASSQAINEAAGPAIVISASGMCNAGRIKHHLRHNIWRPGASIVFAGYQAMGTPGRKIVNGSKKIRILGEEVVVRAKIFTINGFSAHAGQNQILDWLSNFTNKAMSIFLVHGEPKAQNTLAALIKEKFGFEIFIPEYLESVTLKPGKAFEFELDLEKSKPGINWAYLVENSEKLVEDFKEKLDVVEGKPWEDQTELRDRLLDMNKKLMEVISEL